MKIVTVGYLHGAGGAERQIILLSNQLVSRGHDVTLVILSENNSHYPIDSAVKILDLSQQEYGFFKILKRFIAFKNVINNIRPDLIINYNLQSAYFCLILPKEARGKVIYSERGDPYDKEYSGMLGLIRDMTVKYMDGLVFQTEGARDFFKDTIKQKSIVIPNSVNVPSIKRLDVINNEKRIVNIGRLHPQKNQRLLITAFGKIADLFPDYTLDIYGDGELKEELLNCINDLNLGKRIRIYPSRNNIWDSIYNAPLFVLTSDYEGMPNALMEAMALGMPCISTDCRPGGAKALINNGENGFIVPCGDAEKLALQMKVVLENHLLQEQIGRKAQEITRTHSEKEIFDRWNAYIKNVYNK